MGREDATFVFAGAYESEADAQLDYEAIKELHAAGVIGGYDAAVIRKGDDGKVHVNKDETSTRKGAWGGAVVGAVVGILFPPSIIAGAAIGALAENPVRAAELGAAGRARFASEFAEAPVMSRWQRVLAELKPAGRM
jgi:uncharacterized membrane protein